MKLKILFFLLLILTANSFAQSENIKIDISIEENSWWKISSQNPLEVKITNISDQTFNTQKVNNIELYFSKCRPTEKCHISGDTYVANAKIEKEIIPKNESHIFKIDLSDLYWVNDMSSSYDFSQPKNFITVPISNNHLYAQAQVVSSNSTSTKTPNYQSYKSNEIIFDRKYKSSE